jgi:hypothetical protein
MPQPFGNHSRLHLETLEDRHLPSTVAGVYADGTWRYDTTAGWTQISNLRANGLDVDDGGNVYGSYSSGTPSDGLWRWNAATASWARLSNLQAYNFQVTAGGVLYGDFGTQGLWRWSNSGWMLLSGLSAERIAVSDSDAFFSTFNIGSPGTWRWTPTAGWSLLSSSIPAALQTDNAGDCIGYFPASGPVGTWRWSPITGWAHLSTGVPIFFDVSTNGAIYESRGLGGLWYAAPGASSFTQIDSADNQGTILTALPDGSLYADRISTAGPHVDGWYWNPNLRSLGFLKLFQTDDRSSQPLIGKDGDLFFRDNTPDAKGTGYWSLTSFYHLLGGPSGAPNFLVSQR